MYTYSRYTMSCTLTADTQCHVHLQQIHNAMYTYSRYTMSCTLTADTQCHVHLMFSSSSFRTKIVSVNSNIGELTVSTRICIIIIYRSTAIIVTTLLCMQSSSFQDLLDVAIKFLAIPNINRKPAHHTLYILERLHAVYTCDKQCNI